MTPRKRGDLGTKGLNFGKRVVSSLRRTLVPTSAIRVPEKASAPLCVYLQCVAAEGQPAAKAVAALFVGKNSRANAHFGVLLCGAEYQRESAPERPLIRVVPYPRANGRRAMVKHSCCAQCIAQMADFLGIRARAGAANYRIHRLKPSVAPEKIRVRCWHVS